MQLRGRLCDHVKREVTKGHTGLEGSEQRLEGGEGVGHQISVKSTPGGGNSWSKGLEVGGASWFWKKSKEATVTAARGQEEEMDSKMTRARW